MGIIISPTPKFYGTVITFGPGEVGGMFTVPAGNRLDSVSYEVIGVSDGDTLSMSFGGAEVVSKWNVFSPFRPIFFKYFPIVEFDAEISVEYFRASGDNEIKLKMNFECYRD